MSTDYSGDNLVFIVGCGRSGTTWVQQLLACHPKVRTGQESYVFAVYIGPQLKAWKTEIRWLTDHQLWDGLSCYFLDAQYRAILKDYMLKLLSPMIGNLPPGYVFVDKTPGHTYWIREITELLPNSRIIHVIRDGRDVVASLMSASKGWGATWAPHSPTEAAKIWKQNINAVRIASNQLRKENFLEVRYEDLKSSTTDVLRNISDFAGLIWTDAEIAEAVRRNDARSGLKNAPQIPLFGEVGRLHGPYVQFPEGFVRKARPGSWREDLGVLARIRVWRAIRKQMNQEGYHWKYPWN